MQSDFFSFLLLIHYSFYRREEIRVYFLLDDYVYCLMNFFISSLQNYSLVHNLGRNNNHSYFQSRSHTSHHSLTHTHNFIKVKTNEYCFSIIVFLDIHFCRYEGNIIYSFSLVSLVLMCLCVAKVVDMIVTEVDNSEEVFCYELSIFICSSVRLRLHTMIDRKEILFYFFPSWLLFAFPSLRYVIKIGVMRMTRFPF